MEVIDFTNAPGWPTPDARQLLKNVAISRGMGFAFVRSGVHEDSWDQFNKKVKDLPHVTMMFKKDRDDSVEWPAHVYVDAEDKLVLRGVRWYKSVQR